MYSKMKSCACETDISCLWHTASVGGGKLELVWRGGRLMTLVLENTSLNCRYPSGIHTCELGSGLFTEVEAARRQNAWKQWIKEHEDQQVIFLSSPWNQRVMDVHSGESKNDGLFHSYCDEEGDVFLMNGADLSNKGFVHTATVPFPVGPTFRAWMYKGCCNEWVRELSFSMKAWLMKFQLLQYQSLLKDQRDLLSVLSEYLKWMADKI